MFVTCPRSVLLGAFSIEKELVGIISEITLGTSGDTTEVSLVCQRYTKLAMSPPTRTRTTTIRKFFICEEIIPGV
jgi:hypothetical protein